MASVPDAYKVLVDRRTAWSGPPTTQAPKIGLDGKYQFNMYDPDGTRVEVMNFHATEKPCCSPFTADDPAEWQGREQGNKGPSHWGQMSAVDGLYRARKLTVGGRAGSRGNCGYGILIEA